MVTNCDQDFVLSLVGEINLEDQSNNIIVITIKYNIAFKRVRGMS